MKFQLSRLNVTVEILPGQTTTIEIEDRQVFSRIVYSLMSELGEDGPEPYRIWNDKDEKVSPRGALLRIKEFPQLPLSDKGFLVKLYKHIDSFVLQSEQLSEKVGCIAQLVGNTLAATEMELRGSYEFGIDFNTIVLLKALSYSPAQSDEYSLLDNCISFFELLADINWTAPVLLVNSKSFFSSDECEQVMQQAFFNAIPLLLLESWHDSSVYALEEKTIVDQHLLVQ
jgi:CRISPR type II-A-associated protein Csn2